MSRLRTDFPELIFFLILAILAVILYSVAAQSPECAPEPPTEMEGDPSLIIPT